MFLVRGGRDAEVGKRRRGVVAAGHGRVADDDLDALLGDVADRADVCGVVGRNDHHEQVGRELDGLVDQAGGVERIRVLGVRRGVDVGGGALLDVGFERARAAEGVLLARDRSSGRRPSATPLPSTFNSLPAARATAAWPAAAEVSRRAPRPPRVSRPPRPRRTPQVVRFCRSRCASCRLPFARLVRP